MLLSFIMEDSFENGASHPKTEKKLAWAGAVGGGLVGALVIGFIFAIPAFFWDFPFETLLVVIGTILGAINGAGAGPLITLRLSKVLGPKVSSHPWR